MVLQLYSTSYFKNVYSLHYNSNVPWINDNLAMKIHPHFILSYNGLLLLLKDTRYNMDSIYG